jgi:cytochrome c-type biogenesis protein CcmH/NrfF
VTTRRVQWTILGLLGAVVLWAVVSGSPAPGTAEDLAERLACPVCDGESVAASQTDVARSMYDQIERLQAEGLSDTEVLEWFEARYGPEILLDPPRDLGGLLLWVVPLAVAVGGIVVALRLRRSRPDPGDEPDTQRSGTARTLVTIGVLGIALVAAAFALGTFLEPRAAGTPVSGDLQAPTDLESISDETLAATIASFEAAGDVPATQLNGMRLALAERYFEAGDYRSATSVFQDVLAAEPTSTQQSEALGRLGWILWVNDQAEAAEAAFAQAMDAQPQNGEARYFYALMLLDQDRGPEAVPLLEALAADPAVPADLLPEIEAMLAEARA